MNAVRYIRRSCLAVSVIVRKDYEVPTWLKRLVRMDLSMAECFRAYENDVGAILSGDFGLGTEPGSESDLKSAWSFAVDVPEKTVQPVENPWMVPPVASSIGGNGDEEGETPAKCDLLTLHASTMAARIRLDESSPETDKRSYYTALVCSIAETGTKLSLEGVEFDMSKLDDEDVDDAVEEEFVEEVYDRCLASLDELLSTGDAEVTLGSILLPVRSEIARVRAMSGDQSLRSTYKARIALYNIAKALFESMEPAKLALDAYKPFTLRLLEVLCILYSPARTDRVLAANEKFTESLNDPDSVMWENMLPDLGAKPQELDETDYMFVDWIVWGHYQTKDSPVASMFWTAFNQRMKIGKSGDFTGAEIGGLLDWGANLFKKTGDFIVTTSTLFGRAKQVVNRVMDSEIVQKMIEYTGALSDGIKTAWIVASEKWPFLHKVAGALWGAADFVKKPLSDPEAITYGNVVVLAGMPSIIKNVLSSMLGFFLPKFGFGGAIVSIIGSLLGDLLVPLTTFALSSVSPWIPAVLIGSVVLGTVWGLLTREQRRPMKFIVLSRLLHLMFTFSGIGGGTWFREIVTSNWANYTLFGVHTFMKMVLDIPPKKKVEVVEERVAAVEEQVDDLRAQMAVIRVQMAAVLGDEIASDREEEDEGEDTDEWDDDDDDGSPRSMMQQLRNLMVQVHRLEERARVNEAREEAQAARDTMTEQLVQPQGYPQGGYQAFATMVHGELPEANPVYLIPAPHYQPLPSAEDVRRRRRGGRRKKNIQQKLIGMNISPGGAKFLEQMFTGLVVHDTMFSGIAQRAKLSFVRDMDKYAASVVEEPLASIRKMPFGRKDKEFFADATGVELSDDLTLVEEQDRPGYLRRAAGRVSSFLGSIRDGMVEFAEMMAMGVPEEEDDEEVGAAIGVVYPTGWGRGRRARCFRRCERMFPLWWQWRMRRMCSRRCKQRVRSRRRRRRRRW